MPTILIVDDEPANLALLNEVLAPHFRVLAANSGQRALALIVTSPQPDLILLDIMMPGKDGYMILREIIQNPATADIPIIFVTALNDEHNEEYGLNLGAVDYISKPIKPALVLARVRTHLELKLARDRMREQNRWLEEEVAQRVSEIELVQDVSLAALAELAETRDDDTGNHILRTQSYIAQLTKFYLASDNTQLDEHTANMIVKASPLHDVGKVGIPDAILLKPAPLTPEEFAIMKTHAEIGANAIAQALKRALNMHTPVTDKYARHALDVLETAQDIARSHHERWDGKGYPHGLAGEAIPFSARLMALADVYDALISERIYKAAMLPEQAWEIILEGKGKQFDPAVVEAFDACHEEFGHIARRFQDSSK